MVLQGNKRGDEDCGLVPPFNSSTRPLSPNQMKCHSDPVELTFTHGSSYTRGAIKRLDVLLICRGRRLSRLLDPALFPLKNAEGKRSMSE